MAKKLLLAVLIATAAAFTADAAFNANFNIDNQNSPLKFTGESKGPGSDGYWTDLFSPPYGDCPTVMVAIGCTSTDACYVPAGVNGVGFGMTKFDGSPGGKFVEMDMPSKPMMLMALGLGTDSRGVARGAVGGIGLGHNLQYLKDGTSWIPSNMTADAPLFFPTQCIRASADGQRVLSVVADAIGNELPMVLYSTNAGANFTTRYINAPLVTNQTRPRYAAIPTPDVWYVTAGNWPSSNLHGEDAIFTSPAEAKLRGVDTQNVYALSDRLAVVRDAKTGKLQHKVRDVLRSSSLAPPAPKTGSGYSAQIFRTTDGGKTFKSVFEDVDTFYFNGIDCVDARTCYAVGSGDRAVYIYGTRDGGDSWKVVYELPRTNGAYYSLMSIGVTEGTVIAAGGGQSGSGYESFTLTSEDGVTWTRQAGLPGIGDIAAMSLLPGGYGFATAVTVYQTSTILALRPKGSPTLPPVPTEASFSQSTCEDYLCTQGCNVVTFPQNKCLKVNGGGSAVVRCDSLAKQLIQDMFDDGACSGNVTTRRTPLDKCLQSVSGYFFQNSCSN